MSNPVIHWFRRDLRIRDNTALHAACETDRPVIPLFIIDPDLVNSQRVGAPRMKFMLQALSALDDTLQQYGTRLLVRHGKPEQIIPQLINDSNAEALYINRDYTPYARERDGAIEDSLDVDVHIYDDTLLMPPGSILKNDGDPYIVYSYFWRKWKDRHKPEVSTRHFRNEWFYDLSELQNDGVSSLADLGFPETIDLPRATEDTARNRLDDFMNGGVQRYEDTRNNLTINPFGNTDDPASDVSSTSYLSPYLRFGILSPRQAYHAARNAYKNAANKQQKESIESWVSELAWREFYLHILYFFPHVLERDFNDTYDALQWRDAPDELQCWKEGNTGYPVVDAPMRQLKAIGWMPNRARMIVASFLTKDLLIHWKAGDYHFMKHLIDGDPASNNGGWQWAAGTGTDAQPYFRIFNPVSQSKKHATPEYLRYWLPELNDVPDKYIHEPWTMDSPPADYPAPIVDHSAARERTLSAFKAARGDD